MKKTRNRMQNRIENLRKYVAIAIILTLGVVYGATSFVMRGEDYTHAGTGEINNWADLESAINNASDGATITLNKSMVATKTLNVSSGKNLTIKGSGNGVTIYRDKNNADFPVFNVNGGKLTLGEKLTMSGKASDCRPAADQNTFKIVYHNGGTGDKAKVSAPEVVNGSFTAKTPEQVKSSEGNSAWSAPEEGLVFDCWKFYGPNGNENTKQAGQSWSIPSGTHYGTMTLVAQWKKPGTGSFKVVLTNGVTGPGARTEEVTYNPGTKLIFTRNNTWGKVGSSGLGLVVCEPAGWKYKDWNGNFGQSDGADSGLVVPEGVYGTLTLVLKLKLGDEYYNNDSAVVDFVPQDVSSTPYSGANAADYPWTAQTTSSQSCDENVIDATYADSNNVSGNTYKFTSGTQSEPKGFFVSVTNNGTLNMTGAKMTDVNTDESVKNVAPVVATSGTVNMSAGEISNNRIGYGANDQRDSQSSVKTLRWMIIDTTPTNSAGAMIVSGENAKANISGSAKMTLNRADAGALIVKDNAKVEMNSANAEISLNVGWHHSGGVLVENGATFHLKNGKIINNVAWLKGGAVWATEFGTVGLVSGASDASLENKRQGRTGGNFIMYGGLLDGNFAFMRAGAIEVESNGVQLNGGTISNNKCKSLGGAIYVEGDKTSYTYTLNIKNAFISDNEAIGRVKNDDLDMRFKGTNEDLSTGLLKTGDAYNSNGGYHIDQDRHNYGDEWSGDGGGIWFCPFGTVIFTSTNDGDQGEPAQVYISGNRASNQNNSDWGKDVYVDHSLKNATGSALIQNLLGNWHYDDGSSLTTNGSTSVLVNGPKGMYNETIYSSGPGVQIIGNMSRNGGGIASNGTLVFGRNADEYDFEAEFNLRKVWSTGTNEQPVTIKLYYEHNGQRYPLVLDGNACEIEVGTDEGINSNPNGSGLHKTGKNSAVGFIPATIKHSDDTVINLYRIYNQQSNEFGKIVPSSSDEFIDLEDSSHLKGLFDYINTASSSEVPLKIQWNIIAAEEGENAQNFEMTAGNVNGTANAKVESKNELDQNGQPIAGSTRMFFMSDLTFGQTLTNGPVYANVELTKTDIGGEAITGKSATFELYGTDYSGKVKDLLNDRDELKGGVTFAANANPISGFGYITSNTANGKIELNNLEANKAYLLFEKVAPSGFIKSQVPWLILVKSNGSYMVFKYDGAAGSEGWSSSKFKKLTGDNERNLVNELEVKLTKVGPGGSGYSGTATFNIYNALRDNGRRTYCYTDDASVTDSKIATVTTNNGTLDLSGVIKSVGAFSGEKNFIIKETAVSDSQYSVQKAPWLLTVNSNGGYTLKVYNNINASPDAINGSKRWEHWLIDNFVSTDLTAEGKLENKWPPIELTKIDASTEQGLSGATFELYEVEARSNLGVLNSEHNQNLLKPLNVETIVSGADGKIELPINKKGLYFLFETKAADGYSRAKSPWLIYVDDNRNAKVVAIQADMEGKYFAGSAKDGYYPSTRDELTNWVKNKWWKKTWFNLSENTQTHNKHDNNNPIAAPVYEWVSSDETSFVSEGKLPNDKLSIELSKVNSTTGLNIATEDAKFALYEVNAEPRHLFENGEPKSANFDIKVKSTTPIAAKYIEGDGKLSFTNVYANKLYLLFETEAPKGYKRSRAPWLIHVKEDGTYTVYKYAASKVKFYDAQTDNTSIEELNQTALVGWNAENNYLSNMIFPTTEQIDNAVTGGFNYAKLTGDNAGKLVNEPIEIEFEKIKKNDPNTKLNDAIFDLYYAKKSDTGDKYVVDTTRGTDGKAAASITAINGKYKVRIPDSTPNTGEAYAYFLLFETKVANGYADPIVPWGLVVDADGNISQISSGDQLGLWREFTSYQLENEPVEIELIKYDHDDETRLLSGAEFRLLKLINSDTINEQGILNPLENAQQPLVYDESFGNDNNESGDDADNDIVDDIGSSGGDDSGDVGGNTGGGANTNESILTSLTADKVADGQKIIIADTKSGDRRLFVAPDNDRGLVRAYASKTKDNYTDSDTDAVWYLDEYKYGNQTYYAIKSSTGKYLFARVYDDNKNSALYASSKFYTYGTDGGNYYYQTEARTSLFKINDPSGGEGGMDIRAVWRVWDSQLRQIVTKEQKICVQTQDGYRYMAGKAANSTTRTIELCVEKDNAGQDDDQEEGDDTPGTDTPGDGTSPQDQFTHGKAMVETPAGSGTYKVDGLTDGYYQIVELAAPTGYELIPDTKKTRMIFQVKNGKIEKVIAGSDPRFAKGDNTLQLKLANDELTSKEARKEWPDGKPDNVKSIEFKLYADRGGRVTLVDTKRVSANTWKTTFNDLPKYYYDHNNERQEIRYYIEEGQAFDATEGGNPVHITGYTPIQSTEPETDTKPETLIIHNRKINGGTIQLTVNKVWADENDKAKEVRFLIWSDYEEAGFDNKKQVPINSDLLVLNEANKWTLTIGTDDDDVELPLYGIEGAPRKVQYWIQEVGVEGFTQISADGFTLLEGGFVQTKFEEKVRTGDDNHTYYAYTIKNPAIDDDHISHLEHFVTRPDGTTEQVFCLNHEWKEPTEYTSKPGSETGTQYKRKKVTAEQLKNYMNGGDAYIGRLTSNNYKDLYYKILKVLYYGSGSDASNLKDQISDPYKDNKLAHMTQYAIYEYTDFYGKQETTGNGYTYVYNYKTKNKADSNWSWVYGAYEGANWVPAHYEKEGPHGLITFEQTGYPDYKRVLESVRPQYGQLMQLIEACDDQTIDDLGLTFYIYEPVNKTSNGKNYQYLIGVDSGVVRTHTATLKNERSTADVVIYKHGSEETDEDKVPLNGVEFELYEKDDNGTVELYNDGQKFKQVGGTYTTRGILEEDKGKITIEGLTIGKTYYLKEKATVTGYIKADGIFVFELSATDEDALSTEIWNESYDGSTITLKTGANITTTLKVTNKPMYNLPNSGGMGTYWFMTIGAMMMAYAAASIFIRRSRGINAIGR